MKDFIGRKELVRYLKRTKITALPHHAFLFVGPNHIGKTYLSTAWMDHLGISERIPLASEQEDGSFRTISVEEVRESLATLSRTSFSGTLRCVLINRADDLSEGASNALLKSLEEPPERTIFVLLATDTRALLPTIVSRCFVLRCTLVPTGTLSEVLPEASRATLDVSANRPGIAVSLLGHEAMHTDAIARMERIRYRVGHSFSDGATRGLDLDEKDFEIMEIVISSALRGDADSERALSLYDGLSRAYHYLSANMNAARSLESAFL